MSPAINLGVLPMATQSPYATAFIGLDAALHATECSYAELDARADAVARQLESRGIGAGDRVAILAANSIGYVASLLGIMRAGCVAVPINFKFPPAMIAFALQDSGARLVFCDAPRLADVPQGMAALPLDEHPLQPGGARLPYAAHAPAPGEAAMMLYTSGSTGKPKGVLLSHEGHAWVVRARLPEMRLPEIQPSQMQPSGGRPSGGRPSDAAADPGSTRGGAPGLHRVLVAAPLFHMNALALVLLGLGAGATTVLLPQFTVAGYLAAIDRYRCTLLTSVPPMIAMLLREPALLAQADLSCVRAIRMGSAPASPSLFARIAECFPQARVINAYGTTEGGPVVFGPHPQGLPTPTQSVGHAREDVAVRLAREDNDLEDHGVLQMKSPALMLGYHRRADLRTPFTPDGYYDTGDVFRRDENGFYYFVGRRDDMFVTGGENVFPSEVERMLERHPQIQQACVVPVPDEIKGTKPVAFVVARAGASIDADEIRAYALANAPAYQHPRHVWQLAALPLASTNKIDRKALAADARQRIAAGERPAPLVNAGSG